MEKKERVYEFKLIARSRKEIHGEREPFAIIDYALARLFACLLRTYPAGPSGADTIICAR